MDEYELSLDSVFFFDAHIVGEIGREFVASMVWLYNFQWSSWTKSLDSPEVMIEQWNKADVIVSFDEEEIIMSLMKSQFGLKYDAYVNLVDYCEEKLIDTAAEIGLEYPEELKRFDKSQSTQMWMDFIQGNAAALNALLFYSAWNTELIYHIFFRVCGDTAPISIFIPWTLEQPKKQAKSHESKVQDSSLYETLKRSYDFSNPRDE
ncbi:MAG: hypothetical protein PHV82_16705 [Victivallaceae bacterium]|nr:hypothetical protein [Victivallaceae bacterium]